MTDLDIATKYFCNEFEKAGTPHMDRRISEANRIFNHYMG